MSEPATGDQRRALLLVLVAVGSVQLGGALAATLIPEVGVVGSVALRIAIGAAILLAWARPRLRGRSRSDWVSVATYAGVLTLMNLTFYASLERLPIGVAVTIEFIGPLTLALVLSRRAADLVGVAAAAGGVVLVSGAVDTSWSELDLLGIALALTAGACWAGYILASRRVGVRFEQIDGLALGLALSTLVMVPLGAITAGGSLLQGDVLLKGLGIAILSSALPYSLELVALRTLRPNVFGILLSLEPAAAALAGLLVLGQTLSAVRIAGMLLVVAASAVVLGRRPAPPAAES